MFDCFQAAILPHARNAKDDCPAQFCADLGGHAAKLGGSDLATSGWLWGLVRGTSAVLCARE